MLKLLLLAESMQKVSNEVFRNPALPTLADSITIHELPVTYISVFRPN